jgi:hypothetical protein
MHSVNTANGLHNGNKHIQNNGEATHLLEDNETSKNIDDLASRGTLEEMLTEVMEEEEEEGEWQKLAEEETSEHSANSVYKSAVYQSIPSDHGLHLITEAKEIWQTNSNHMLEEEEAEIETKERKAKVDEEVKERYTENEEMHGRNREGIEDHAMQNHTEVEEQGSSLERPRGERGDASEKVISPSLAAKYLSSLRKKELRDSLPRALVEMRMEKLRTYSENMVQKSAQISFMAKLDTVQVTLNQPEEHSATRELEQNHIASAKASMQSIEALSGIHKEEADPPARPEEAEPAQDANCDTVPEEASKEESALQPVTDEALPAEAAQPERTANKELEPDQATPEGPPKEESNPPPAKAAKPGEQVAADHGWCQDTETAEPSLKHRERLIQYVSSCRRTMPYRNPSQGPEVQRKHACKRRYGENESGKWVRSSAFRTIDYDPKNPDKLREFKTFDEAFEFDEECRSLGTGGRRARHMAQPRVSVPREQLALKQCLKHAVADDGNKTRMKLDKVEDCIHARSDAQDGELVAIKAGIKMLLACNELTAKEISGRFAWIAMSPLNDRAVKFYYDKDIDGVFCCAESRPPPGGVVCELAVVDFISRDYGKVYYEAWENKERYGAMRKKDVLKFSDNVKTKHGAKLSEVQEKIRDLHGIVIEEKGEDITVEFKDFEPRAKGEIEKAVFKVELLEWLCPKPLPGARYHTEQEEGRAKAHEESLEGEVTPDAKKSLSAKAKAKVKLRAQAEAGAPDPEQAADVDAIVGEKAEPNTGIAHVESSERSTMDPEGTKDKLSVGNARYLAANENDNEKAESTSRPKTRRRHKGPEKWNSHSRPPLSQDPRANPHCGAGLQTDCMIHEPLHCASDSQLSISMRAKGKKLRPREEDMVFDDAVHPDVTSGHEPVLPPKNSFAGNYLIYYQNVDIHRLENLRRHRRKTWKMRNGPTKAALLEAKIILSRLYYRHDRMMGDAALRISETTQSRMTIIKPFSGRVVAGKKFAAEDEAKVEEVGHPAAEPILRGPVCSSKSVRRTRKQASIPT